jgi:hypothetical protein
VLGRIFDLARFGNYVQFFAMTMPPTLNGEVSLVNRTDTCIPIVFEPTNLTGGGEPNGTMLAQTN